MLKENVALYIFVNSPSEREFHNTLWGTSNVFPIGGRFNKMESVMYPRSRSKAVYKRQTSVGGPVASIFIKGNVGQKGSTYLNQETILSYKSFAQI